ncbi:hypothetical protein HYC85_007303 [Camellia sinensis]|uniref:Uncharacterized protein n=1 Tax=Camellia sinensis TaxID=4442 RepID=A0A7J7HPT8_CAMSI|nr:hypothetical protein HYC85_007303 [Camellia sinensis]
MRVSSGGSSTRGHSDDQYSTGEHRLNRLCPNDLQQKEEFPTVARPPGGTPMINLVCIFNSRPTMAQTSETPLTDPTILETYIVHVDKGTAAAPTDKATATPVMVDASQESKDRAATLTATLTAINRAVGAKSAKLATIFQAWADLRDSLQHQSFCPHHLQSLKTLLNSRASLYVADPQAKLLISILSSTNISLPPESYPLFLRLLYTWVRKSSRPSPVLIDSAVKILSHLCSSQCNSDSSCPPGLLEEEYQLLSSSEQHIPDVLAWIGYALSSSGNVYVVRILDSLFGIWNRKDKTSGSVSHGLMILHLIEWVLSNFINSQSLKRVDVFTKEVLETSNPNHASFATVMGAAGEERIEVVARVLISGTRGFTNSSNNPENSLLLKCISLALGRSGSVSFQAPLLLCLASALLTEIFPLQSLHTRVLQYQHGNLAQLGPKEIKEHLNSVPFKEAGAITGVFCNQYASANEDNESVVENLIWDYCQDTYLGHQQVALFLRGREDELLGHLEKIVESAFLMVVIFSMAVTKHKLDSKFTQELQMDISVKILVSFSCMEYFWRMRLPEYLDTIRAVVVAVQENESACVLFVESMPSYYDLRNQPDMETMKCQIKGNEVATEEGRKGNTPPRHSDGRNRHTTPSQAESKILKTGDTQSRTSRTRYSRSNLVRKVTRRQHRFMGTTSRDVRD